MGVWVPGPRSGRGTQSQVWGKGVPGPRSGGYPIPGVTWYQVWGYPIPGLAGGYPIPGLARGVPHPDLVIGYPLARPGMGYPPDQTWDGVTPLARPGMGYSPARPDWGTPLPPRYGLTNKLKIVPSPILWMWAVIMQSVKTCLFKHLLQVGSG